MIIQPFHLAVSVSDLDETRSFYIDTFNCDVGRETPEWVDLNFYGHQLVLHFDKNKKVNNVESEVDGHGVPIPHFGVVLSWDDWKQLKDELISKNFEFIIKPYIRFEGQPGEQGTMFFKDPSGNTLEFKSFKDMSRLFAK
jgi:extradiol dioxygenase family protein